VELILVVVGAVIITAVSRRRGVQPALVIVLIGLAVSFMPGFHGIRIDSQVMLSVVVPPLLYSAALDFSFPTFLRNIRPIVGLGVGLVVITAFAVAGVTHWFCRRFRSRRRWCWGPWWRRRTRSRRWPSDASSGFPGR
jgi:monovalent cation/hydrogen antiporter